MGQPANPLSFTSSLCLNVCLMADNEVGIFAEMTCAPPLLDTHTHTGVRSLAHTQADTQALTKRKGWLSFRTPGPALIFKWLLLLPQDFQSISGHILRWRDCQRGDGSQENAGNMCARMCVCVRERATLGCVRIWERGRWRETDDVIDVRGWAHRMKEIEVVAS